MQNIVETVIVLGTVTGIVAMFTHVSNKAIKAAHEKEIDMVNGRWESAFNSLKNTNKRLLTDINILCGEKASDSDRRLIIKHYVNNMNIDNIFLEANKKLSNRENKE